MLQTSVLHTPLKQAIHSIQQELDKGTLQPQAATARLLSYIHYHNMSKITATINLDNTWSLKEIGPGTNRYEVEFHINADSTNVRVEQLQFGYVLKKENLEIAKGSFPSSGRYISIASTHLETALLTADYDTDYGLEVWAVNNGTLFYSNLAFSTGRPTSPYPSWLWNNGVWTCPVNYPTDGKYYGWNEETAKWITLTQ
jgi:hypothetical protein